MDTIGLQFGERLVAEGTLGNATYNEFLRLIAGLHSWSGVEHNGDGTHNDITVDSITFSGDGAGSVGRVIGVAGGNRLEWDGTDITLVENALTIDGDGIRLEPWITSYNPEHAYRFTAADGDFGVGGVTSGASSAITVRHTRTTPVGFVTADLTVQNGTGNPLGYVSVSADAFGGTTVDIQGAVININAVPLGVWVPVAFSAASFTGNGAMTWTLTSGDQLTYGYTLIDKTMTVAFVLATTTVGGTPNTLLQLAIPGGYVAAKDTWNGLGLVIDAGVGVAGGCGVAPGGTVIQMRRYDGANWTAGVDTTYVYGEISFEIQ